MSTDSPHDLLAAAQHLSERTRLAQRHTWMPLLVLGLLVGAWPLVGLSGPPGSGCGPTVQTAAGPSVYCAVAGANAFFWYWTLGLSGAYVLITCFYLWCARRQGLGTRVARYFWAWIAGLAMILVAVWFAHSQLHTLTSTGDRPGLRLAAFTPQLAIAAGLLVLAWVERFPALAWFAAGYVLTAAVVLVTTWPSRQVSHHLGGHPLAFAASRYLLLGAILIIGSIGFSVSGRSHR